MVLRIYWLICLIAFYISLVGFVAKAGYSILFWTHSIFEFILFVEKSSFVTNFDCYFRYFYDFLGTSYVYFYFVTRIFTIFDFIFLRS